MEVIMGLRRSLNTARRHVRSHRLARTLAATLAVVAVLTCVVGYRTAAATAATSKAPIVVNAQKYGAKGDGRYTDSQAMQRAIDAVAARPGSTVYLPKGTYYCPKAIRLHSHVNLRGAGMSASWLEGHLDFASHSTVSRLKIGAARVSAVANLKGATHTTFTHVRFRGGGGTGNNCAVLMLGSSSGSRSLNHVTFSHCEVERNLGTENWSVNGGSGRDFNDISVYENPAAGGSHVSDLTFVGCHVGVSNGAGGHDIGSPRAGIEVWTGHGRVVHGWHRITLRNCVFEATDRFCIDLADHAAASGKHLAGPALIEGNLIKGGGYGPGEHPWSYSICLEAPRNVTIRHNTIYAAYGSTVCGSSGPASHTVIVDNLIDLTVANGVHQTGDEAVVLKGQSGVFKHNVVKAGVGSGPLLYLKQTSGNHVADNRFFDTRTSGNPAMVLLRDARRNVLTNNLFSTAASSAPRILIEGASVANTLRPNTFRHR
jgi:hypothetical protein